MRNCSTQHSAFDAVSPRNLVYTYSVHILSTEPQQLVQACSRETKFSHWQNVIR